MSNWRLAWGRVDDIKDETWREEAIALFTSALAISPSRRYVVTGDVCLTGHLANLELIAQSWDDLGEDTLVKLVGMFSLAIWDRQTKKLCLARDRSGAYTVYYTTQGPTCWAASRLADLKPYHSKEIDTVALRDYLCCAFVPGNRTMWSQVKELRPGTSLSLPGQKSRAYWQLQEEIKDGDRPLEWHGQQLRILLNQVVKEYLPPEGEAVGVYLSGGLDSSCITALASQLHNAPVHTYSLHFGEKFPNELDYSSLVAKHCQTEHHILEISPQELWKQLPEAIKCLDNPIGDPLTVPNLLIGKIAKAQVNIILNGEGGDPCFGGPKNQPMLINYLYTGVTQADPLQAYLISFQKCAADLSQLLKPPIWETVKYQPYVFEEDLRSTASYLNRLMALNIKYKGADHILTKVNNLTKSLGLLGKSPLFDQRIVERSMQIPPEYKLSGVEEKAVLKAAVADCIPLEIIQRPKSGMMVPVQVGFRDYWNRQARDLLLHKKAKIAPYLNQFLIKDWLNYKGDVWQRYGVKLWLLATLEYWLQIHN